VTDALNPSRVAEAGTSATPSSRAYERARALNGGPLKEEDPKASNWYCMREPCYQVRHDAAEWDGDMPVCSAYALRMIYDGRPS